MLRRYIKNLGTNKKVGVLLALLDKDNNICIGWSKCHQPLDSFDKQRGVDIAMGRLTKLLEGERGSKDRIFSKNSLKQLNQFTDSCKQYFKQSTGQVKVW